MSGGLNQMGRPRALKMFADWTDRIAAGEVPPAPPRPQGQERNVVDHDVGLGRPEGVSARRGVDRQTESDGERDTARCTESLEVSADYLPVLDPKTNTISRVPLTVRDPNTPPTSPKMPQPSPYWGDEVIWTSKNNVHNPMLDEKGRVWITSAVRPSANPDYCKEGSDHPSAKLFPIANAGRHLAMYDPTTKKLTHISTCFGTHHLMFAEDANNTLWTSGGGQVVGWLNRKMFEETGDEVRSQGWTALILDTNGNGKRDAYVEPNQPRRSDEGQTARRRVLRRVAGAGRIGLGIAARLPRRGHPAESGANPPETAMAEVFEPPMKDGVPVEGFSPRGMDIDRNGVAWVAMASGHMASFDRRKCKGPLNGPNATGQHCAEGWTFYTEPLPQMKGVSASGSAESSYYTWVDQFDTSRPRRQHADQHRQPLRRAAGAQGRQVGRAARAVSDRVLHEVAGRTNRRSERRLEGPRALGDGLDARAVPHGNRKGHDEQGRPLPDAARPAGEVTQLDGSRAEAGHYDNDVRGPGLLRPGFRT